MVRGADARPAAPGSVLVLIATSAVSGLPQVAGNTWAFLQWMVGLDRLGVDCYWIDHQPRLDPRRPAVDGRVVPHVDCHSVDYARSRFHAMAEAYGFADRYLPVAKLAGGGARRLLRISHHLWPRGNCQYLQEISEPRNRQVEA